MSAFLEFLKFILSNRIYLIVIGIILSGIVILVGMGKIEVNISYFTIHEDRIIVFCGLIGLFFFIGISIFFYFPIRKLFKVILLIIIALPLFGLYYKYSQKIPPIKGYFVCYKNKDILNGSDNNSSSVPSELFPPYGYSYNECHKTNSSCRDEQMFKFGEYNSPIDQNEAYSRCANNKAKIPHIRPIKPQRSQIPEYLLPEGKQHTDFVYSITEMYNTIYIYTIPQIANGNILFKIDGGSSNIAILANLDILGRKWYKIACFDQQKNIIEGWVVADYVQVDDNSSIPELTEYANINEIPYSVTVYNPIEVHNPIAAKEINRAKYSACRINSNNSPAIIGIKNSFTNGRIISKLIKDAENIYCRYKDSNLTEVTFFDLYGFRHFGFVNSEYISE